MLAGNNNGSRISPKFAPSSSSNNITTVSQLKKIASEGIQSATTQTVAENCNNYNYNEDDVEDDKLVSKNNKKRSAAEAMMMNNDKHQENVNITSTTTTTTTTSTNTTTTTSSSSTNSQMIAENQPSPPQPGSTNSTKHGQQQNQQQNGNPTQNNNTAQQQQQQQQINTAAVLLTEPEENDSNTANPGKRHRTDDTHSFVVSGSKFTVHKRYHLIKTIGHGAYGVVVSANDLLTGEQVAIKKVARAFDDLVDAKRILREIKLLMHFKHENTIGMKDIMYPLAPMDKYEDVYLVTDLMETDLHRIIYSRQPLTDDHVQYFIYQMLRALKYMHSAGVLHRDLKPSNLLLNSNCDLKVCDFGLARGVNDEEVDLTEYVVTRWYRAPEIMLSCKKYTYAIDVWSTGCILAELLGRKPIFPGDDYIHQLQIINEVLGSSTEADLGFVTSEKAKRFMLGLPRKEKVPFQVIFPHANPLAIDLLQKMLVFDPSRRITVQEALMHPYLEAMANHDDEPTCPEPFTFEFERVKLDKQMLQELIWEEMMKFHPDARTEFMEKRANGTLKIDNALL